MILNVSIFFNVLVLNYYWTETLASDYAYNTLNYRLQFTVLGLPFLSSMWLIFGKITFLKDPPL